MAEISKLGRYEIRRILGRGAMGVVYEGFDPTLSRRVAVKTILKSVALNPETERAYAGRFTQEAKAVARLNHPNIVQVYDFGVEGEVAYLVMEFIEGRELRSFFEAKEKFAPGELVRIMGGLLDALDFAHEAGVIHRDVKPANVMLDAQRGVKLADFGVARIQDSAQRSAADTMVGTPAFMSPEQISGKKVDRRTDIFSAGTILYQLLTGEQPFKGEGAWTVAKAIMQDDPPLPSSLVVSVSPVFDGIVYKALAKKPVDRFASAKEFAAALRGALALGAQAAAIVAPKPKARVEPKASEAEVEFWRALQNSNDAAEFEFYLEQFPEGTYAQLARHKIAKLREPQEAADRARREAEERARLEAEERARREAEEKTKQEAQAKVRREVEEKAIREALEKAKREAEERGRQAQAQALARLRQQEEAAARARAAVDDDATVAMAKPPAPAPLVQKKKSLAVPAIAAAVVIAGGAAAYLMLGRTPAPVVEKPVPPKTETVAPAPDKPTVAPIDEARIRREAEERVRREYADKSAAEQAAAAKAAGEKAVAEKQAAAKATAEKAVAEKQAAVKAAMEKAAAEKAAAEKTAAEKAAAERAVAAERTAVAAERAAAERVAAAEKAARVAAEKAAEEKAAAAKAAEKAAELAKAPPVSVAAAAPAAAPPVTPPPREGLQPGRYAFRIMAGSGVFMECDRIDIQEDIEIRAGSSQSISGRDFTDLRFRSAQDGSVAATLSDNRSTRYGTGDVKLAGRATTIGYTGTYEWRAGAIRCTGGWALVRKGN